jgi:hypothetical protein
VKQKYLRAVVTAIIGSEMNTGPQVPPQEFQQDPQTDGDKFLEFRRKVREAEVLSTAMSRLLKATNFTGRLSVVVQNGRVLKSGYEEGYFTRRMDDRMA